MLRHLAADTVLPREFRFDLLKRIGTMAEAAEKRSAPLALKALYVGEDILEERSSSTGLVRSGPISLPAKWNRTVKEFSRAVERSSRSKRGPRK